MHLISLHKITACDSRLGMEDESIPDSRITASSEWNPDHGASNARLNNEEDPPSTGAWSARTNDKKQWIQADLGCLKRVSGVITQGRPSRNFPQWVTKFTVQYSVDGKTWYDVEDANGQKVRICTTI